MSSLDKLAIRGMCVPHFAPLLASPLLTVERQRTTQPLVRLERDLGHAVLLAPDRHRRPQRKRQDGASFSLAHANWPRGRACACGLREPEQLPSWLTLMGTLPLPDHHRVPQVRDHGRPPARCKGRSLHPRPYGALTAFLASRCLRCSSHSPCAALRTGERLASSLAHLRPALMLVLC